MASAPAACARPGRFFRTDVVVSSIIIIYPHSLSLHRNGARSRKKRGEEKCARSGGGTRQSSLSVQPAIERRRGETACRSWLGMELVTASTDPR